MQKIKKFTSQKKYEGFSTCFRQHKAVGTHCKFLHGYGVSFEITFEGQLDERNWVYDFGGLKRSSHNIRGMNPKEYFDWLFDHTVIVSSDDPALPFFSELAKQNVIKLRIFPKVGCEAFAEHILESINSFLFQETQGRVIATKVKFMEHDKNSATAYLQRDEVG